MLLRIPQHLGIGMRKKQLPGPWGMPSNNKMQVGVFPRIKLGVSACLLGQPVRYNGGHKRDGLITGPLADFADFVALCPEVGIGLGAPRPPIRLIGSMERARAIRSDAIGLDVTPQLESFAREKLGSLRDICGFILKSGSPSCGMVGVKICETEDGAAQPLGVGIFARVLMQAMPLVPVEEEGRLDDPGLRASFFTRVFAYERWRRLLAVGTEPKGLLELHRDHKYLIMAYSQRAYARMGAMLANLAGIDMETIASRYLRELMTALKRPADRKGHTNALQHILGYFKHSIGSGDKAELVEAIETYRRGTIPLLEPIILLRRHLEQHPNSYLAHQHYLYPYPDELRLHE
jgi:uncharacterized protein YbgA (DUF1722 family)/uncharacterized protein YbbK (DUF523 family)